MVEMISHKAVITIPILAVVVTSIALSLYLTQSFTLENFEIVSTYVVWHTTTEQYEGLTVEGESKVVKLSNFWEVTVIVKSTGTEITEIKNIVINRRDILSYGDSIICISRVDNKPVFFTYNVLIEPGETAKITLLINFNGSGFSHGEIVEIRIYSQSKEKSTLLCLP